MRGIEMFHTERHSDLLNLKFPFSKVKVFIAEISPLIPSIWNEKYFLLNLDYSRISVSAFLINSSGQSGKRKFYRFKVSRIFSYLFFNSLFSGSILRAFW